MDDAEHGQVLVGEPPHGVDHFLHYLGIESRGRLVEQQDRRGSVATICFRVPVAMTGGPVAEVIVFKGRLFYRSAILLWVRRYLAYNRSLRKLEEMMAERGMSVEHATVGRWVVRYSPELLECFNRRKRLVSRRWHLDETYIKV